MNEEIKITAEPRDPATCTFTIDRPVYPEGSVYFADLERASGSPMPEKLLALEGVESILIQKDMVTVTAQPRGNWTDLAEQVGSTIRSVLLSGETPVSDSLASSLPPADEIRKRVQELLDAEINPGIASHGGWVELIDVKGNELFIRLGGGCQGCGGARMTLKHGVERAIRMKVPEVGAIMDVTDHASGHNPYHQQ